jgi:hypothetical protein
MTEEVKSGAGNENSEEIRKLYERCYGDRAGEMLESRVRTQERYERLTPIRVSQERLERILSPLERLHEMFDHLSLIGRKDPEGEKRTKNEIYLMKLVRRGDRYDYRLWERHKRVAEQIEKLEMKKDYLYEEICSNGQWLGGVYKEQERGNCRRRLMKEMHESKEEPPETPEAQGLGDRELTGRGE